MSVQIFHAAGLVEGHLQPSPHLAQRHKLLRNIAIWEGVTRTSHGRGVCQHGKDEVERISGQILLRLFELEKAEPADTGAAVGEGCGNPLLMVGVNIKGDFSIRKTCGAEAGTGLGREFLLLITTPERTYRLTAEAPDDPEQWRQVITAAAADASAVAKTGADPKTRFACSGLARCEGSRGTCSR